MREPQQVSFSGGQFNKEGKKKENKKKKKHPVLHTLPLHLIQASQEIGTLAKRPTGVMRVIANLPRADLEALCEYVGDLVVIAQQLPCLDPQPVEMWRKRPEVDGPWVRLQRVDDMRGERGWHVEFEQRCVTYPPDDDGRCHPQRQEDRAACW